MWNEFSKIKPNECEEVLAFNSKWIDEDFNPNGIRIGFYNGEDFIKN